VDVGEDQLGRLVKPKHELGAFLPRRAVTGLPNYMPEEVIQMLEAEGFSRADMRNDAGRDGNGGL